MDIFIANGFFWNNIDSVLKIIVETIFLLPEIYYYFFNQSFSTIQNSLLLFRRFNLYIALLYQSEPRKASIISQE